MDTALTIIAVALGGMVLLGVALRLVKNAADKRESER